MFKVVGKRTTLVLYSLWIYYVELIEGKKFVPNNLLVVPVDDAFFHLQLLHPNLVSKYIVSITLSHNHNQANHLLFLRQNGKYLNIFKILKIQKIVFFDKFNWDIWFCTCYIKNVELVHARIETFKPEKEFDTIICRAFAPLARMLEQTKHLLTAENQLLAMKGKRVETEIDELGKHEFLIKLSDLALSSNETSTKLVQIKRTA